MKSQAFQNYIFIRIVTGGGQGIGKAIVKRLLGDGLRVVIAEMDEEAGRETLQLTKLCNSYNFNDYEIA